MKAILTFIAVIIAQSNAAPVQNCTVSAATNILEIHCWGYLECISGVIIRHDCPDGQVLDRDSIQCVDESATNVCEGDVCTGRTGLYADQNDNCETFVQCTGGVLIGRNYCPAKLVFDEASEVCDFNYNVDPPCGTKTVV